MRLFPARAYRREGNIQGKIKREECLRIRTVLNIHVQKGCLHEINVSPREFLADQVILGWIEGATTGYSGRVFRHSCPFVGAFLLAPLQCCAGRFLGRPVSVLFLNSHFIRLQGAHPATNCSSCTPQSGRERRPTLHSKAACEETDTFPPQSCISYVHFESLTALISSRSLAKDKMANESDPAQQSAKQPKPTHSMEEIQRLIARQEKHVSVRQALENIARVLPLGPQMIEDGLETGQLATELDMMERLESFGVFDRDDIIAKQDELKRKEAEFVSVFEKLNAVRDELKDATDAAWESDGEMDDAEFEAWLDEEVSDAEEMEWRKNFKAKMKMMEEEKKREEEEKKNLKREKSETSGANRLHKAA